MTRPTKHPKTGVYRVRLSIPAPLRPTAKALFGRSAEFIENLRTKDPAEARQRLPEALERLHALLASVVATHHGQTRTLTERQVRALAGKWYATEAAKEPLNNVYAARRRLWQGPKTTESGGVTGRFTLVRGIPARACAR